MDFELKEATIGPTANDTEPTVIEDAIPRRSIFSGRTLRDRRCNSPSVKVLSNGIC
jgi:hypothetical protein